MNIHPQNACPPNGHDWSPSLEEAGKLVCQWPGCGAIVDASPAPQVGVDVPGPVLVEMLRRAA